MNIPAFVNQIINNVAQFVTFRNMWSLGLILSIPLSLLILLENYYVAHLEKFNSKSWDIASDILFFITKYLLRFELILSVTLLFSGMFYKWVTK